MSGSTYCIVRFYRDQRPAEVMQRGLTKEAAVAHCQRDDTKGPDWFDGWHQGDDW